MAQADINMVDDSMDEESQEPLIEEVQNDESQPMEGSRSCNASAIYSGTQICEVVFLNRMNSLSTSAS